VGEVKVQDMMNVVDAKESRRLFFGTVSMLLHLLLHGQAHGFHFHHRNIQRTRSSPSLPEARTTGTSERVSVLQPLRPICANLHGTLHLKRGNPEDDDNDNDASSTVDGVNGAIDLLLTPLPGCANLAAGFTLVILIETLFASSLSNAVLTGVLFFGLRIVAQKLIVFEETIDEDVYGIPADNKEKDDAVRTLILQIDAVVFVLSFFVSSLLSASNNEYGASVGVGVAVLPEKTPLVVCIALLAVGVVTLVVAANTESISREEQLSKDDKLLNRWDEKFRDESKK
jgi:hypothetical protein